MIRPRAAALAAALVLLAAAPAWSVAARAQDTWHADQTRLQPAQVAGRGGEGVVVAVLDSWVDAAHPDFQGRVLAGADCLGGVCRPGPAAPDRCDHGTHVAGTVASSSFGVAPRARVLPVRVLSYDPVEAECVGRPDDVTAGIRWAVANGARVLNLSLGPDVPGLSASSSIPQAVEEAARAGVVVVFSAGSRTVPVTDAYGRSALVVAATGPDGRLAGYSQRGSGVDLAAPGGEPATPGVCRQSDCVTSLFPGNRYSVAAGTSMAAPHVAGAAALLLGQDARRTREAVVDRLRSTARPLRSAGDGLLDAQAALGVTPASPGTGAGASAGALPAPPSPAPSPAQALSTPSTVAAPSAPAAAAPLPPLPVPMGTPSPAGSPALAAPSVPAAPAAAPAEEPVPAWAAALATALALGVGSATALAAAAGRRR